MLSAAELGPGDVWLRTNQVCELLGVSRYTVDKLRRTGRLSHVRVSERRINYRKSDVLRFLASHTHAAAAASAAADPATR